VVLYKICPAVRSFNDAPACYRLYELDPLDWFAYELVPIQRIFRHPTDVGSARHVV
jgi:hypothetical protein